jgi:hypothetical protein
MTRTLQSNDELKKMLHEMQGQANQSGAVAALEMEVMDLLQKLDDASQRAQRGEERLVAVEQELSDYKELNDLLEADNAKYVTCLPLAFPDSLFPCSANGRADQLTVHAPPLPCSTACAAHAECVHRLWWRV